MQNILLKKICLYDRQSNKGGPEGEKTESLPPLVHSSDGHNGWVFSTFKVGGMNSPWCHTLVLGAEVREPSAVFPCTLARSWIGSRKTGS